MPSYLNLFVLACLILSGCTTEYISERHRVPVQIYHTTYDYHRGKPSKMLYTAVFDDEGHDYVSTYHFIDPDTDRRVAQKKKPWAVKYKNATYINMRHCLNYGSAGTYAKLDVEGAVCAIFIDKESSTVVRGGADAYAYGLGLAGAIITNHQKSVNKWLNEAGLETSILIIKSVSLHGVVLNEPYTSGATRLKRKNFNQVLATTLTEDEIDKLTVEDIQRILEEINEGMKALD